MEDVAARQNRNLPRAKACVQRFLYKKQRPQFFVGGVGKLDGSDESTGRGGGGVRCGVIQRI